MPPFWATCAWMFWAAGVSCGTPGRDGHGLQFRVISQYVDGTTVGRSVEGHTWLGFRLMDLWVVRLRLAGAVGQP